jgi:HEAT repeats
MLQCLIMSVLPRQSRRCSVRAMAVLVGLCAPLLAPPGWSAPRSASVPKAEGQHPKVPPATRSAVESWLRAHELPPRKDELGALGEGADAALVAIAADEKVEILIRARAISAVAYYPSPEARRLLVGLVGRKPPPAKPAAAPPAGQNLLVRKAAVGLGWMGGLDVPGHLGPLLDDPDPEVRLDAAIGLGLTRLSAAADLLRKRLLVEQDPRVRQQIGRQLHAVEQTRARPVDQPVAPTPTPAR